MTEKVRCKTGLFCSGPVFYKTAGSQNAGPAALYAGMGGVLRPLNNILQRAALTLFDQPDILAEKAHVFVFTIQT